VDARDGQRLGRLQRRQHARQPAREHRLARTGGADQQQMVAARRGDLERAAGHGLAADVGEVLARLARVLGRRRRGGRQLGAAQPRCRFLEPRHRVHREPLDQRRLGGGVRRAEQRLRARAPRRLGEAERAAHAAQAPVERQLADRGRPREPISRHLAGRGEQPERHRQVDRGAFLGSARGGEVHGGLAVGRREAGVTQRRPDPIAHLARGGVGLSGEDEPGQSRTDIHLALDGKGLDAPEGGRTHPAQHRATSAGACERGDGAAMRGGGSPL